MGVRKGIVRYINGRYNRLIKRYHPPQTAKPETAQSDRTQECRQDTELAGQLYLRGPEDMNEKEASSILQREQEDYSKLPIKT